jgi:uncharacterized membrane-anchored protein YhcB (DUF1043 family)
VWQFAAGLLVGVFIGMLIMAVLAGSGRKPD